uniref:Uncharacterized protein n=1 Tax=Meloidogyne javanica TaxID=6303 RepID=A0A915MGV6_MELJA
MSAGYETPVRRWKLLDSLATSKRNPWKDEKQLLESGLHSQFVDGISQCRELCEQKLERIADIRNREVARVETTYKHEVDLLEKEYENRVSEVVETLWLDLEEKKRQLDSDISSLDISRWDGSFGSSDSNWSAHAGQSSSLWMSAQQITSQGILGKKQLRRRPNEVGNCSTNVSSVTAESGVSASVFSEKKGRKRSPSAAHICPLITQSLLSAQAIAEDVENQAHPQFRRAEFESVCLLFGIQPVPNFTPDESHYQLLHFDGGEAVVRCILGRSILLKSAFRILINASSHEIVLEQLSGILLSAAYFCSHVLGVEIKWDVAKAKGKSSRVGEGLLGSDQSVNANFSQYGLNDGRYLGVILADSSKHKMWRHFGFFDAILADRDDFI